MKCRICRVVPQEWDNLLARFPARTVFHTLGWLRAVKDAYKYRLLLMAAYEGDQCVAIWPCFSKGFGPLRALGSPFPGTSTAYLGPLFMAGIDVREVLAEYLRDRTIGRYLYFACRTQNQNQCATALMDLGFTKLRDFETYLLDLEQTEEELWSRLKSECRTRVRKARKSGVTVRLERNTAFLDEFWLMSVSIFSKSARKPTFSQYFLRTAYNNLQQAGHVCAFSAFQGDRRIACLVIPHDDQTMYYWAGGAWRNALHLAPNNLLHWEAIIEGRRRGLSYYDFISTAGSGTYGRFKRTFGPEARTMATHWEHSRGASVRFLKSFVERRLRRRRRTD